MKTQFHILLCLLISPHVWAQSWTFGPRLNAPLSIDHNLTGVEADQTTISLGSVGERTPVQWGAFARYDRPGFFALAEITRGEFSSGGYVSRSNSGFSFYTKSQLVGGNIQAGATLLPWLRLYGGLGYQHHRWMDSGTQSRVDFLERQIREQPNQVYPYDRDRLPMYRLVNATEQAYRTHVFTGQLGTGVDIGGFTLDLAYRRSLTPLLDGIPTATSTLPARQDFGSYLLTFGYRLLPLKEYTLAPRKNKAYERSKRDIPFYRNEFHASLGLLGEDVGSSFIYENRYTRYLRRRLGIAAGLNVMRLYETYQFDGGVELTSNHSNSYQLMTGLRVLPLYSRRHTLGITAGPTLTYQTGIRNAFGGSRFLNGVTYYSTGFRDDSRQRSLLVNWQATLDYNFAPTDRLLVGPWFRLNGLDYGSFGFQAGYRF